MSPDMTKAQSAPVWKSLANMKHSLQKLVFFSAFILVARAEYLTGSAPSLTSTTEIPSPSACGPLNIHRVNVGKDGNKYTPDVIFANPGDTVVFAFYPSGHSVVRGDYTGSQGAGNPCVPVEVLHPGREGFFSGNKMVDLIPTGDDLITWNLTIRDRLPIWFYCNAPSSCHPNGMVGVINPNSSGSLLKQRDAAAAAPFQLSPGQSWPSSAGPMPGSSEAGNHSHGFPVAAIAGIVIGAVGLILLAGGLAYFLGRRYDRRKRDAEQEAHQTAMGNASYGYSTPSNPSSPKTRWPSLRNSRVRNGFGSGETTGFRGNIPVELSAEGGIPLGRSP